ncbi:MAG: thiol:disulfide interchange protein DsbG [Gammaproteobacteria bacterium]
MRVLCLLLVMLVTPVLAGQLPPELQKIEKNGDGKIVSSFPGPAGLTGWVLNMKGHFIIVYSLPGGRYVMSGALVGPDGVNLTQQYMQQYVPKPDFDKAVASLRKDPNLVTEGAPDAPEIFVYADANCIYCNLLWTDLRPYIQTGKVRVHWVMVSILKASSAGRATAILVADDRVAALKQDETRFDKKHEEGGIAAISPVPADVKKMLSQNEEQMSELGGTGTPTILLHTKGKWDAYYGSPRDMAAFIRKLSE